METTELKTAEKATLKKMFDPDVSLIISGLPHADQEDLLVVVKELFRKGLNCDPAPDPVAIDFGGEDINRGWSRWNFGQYRRKWLRSG